MYPYYESDWGILPIEQNRRFVEFSFLSAVIKMVIINANIQRKVRVAILLSDLVLIVDARIFFYYRDDSVIYQSLLTAFNELLRNLIWKFRSLLISWQIKSDQGNFVLTPLAPWNCVIYFYFFMLSNNVIYTFGKC